MKKVDGSTGYGGDWTLRIDAEAAEGPPLAEGAEAGELAERHISLIFYIADEDVRSLEPLSP